MMEDNTQDWLRLDLQTFAEGDVVEGEHNQSHEDDGNNGQDGEQPEGENTPADADKSDDPTSDQKIPYDRFKAKVDEANDLKKRLAKLESDKEAEETRKLEEQNEYKELYEKTQKEMEDMKEQALNQKKQTMLTQAGYSEDQTEYLSKLVEGESDDVIKSSIETLKDTFPTKKPYVDPSVDNSHRQKPAKKTNEDLGRSLFAKIKGE